MINELLGRMMQLESGVTARSADDIAEKKEASGL